MDLITEHQERRLDVLRRVVAAEPVEAPQLWRDLAAFALLVALLVGSVGALLASVLGVLWLLA